MTNLSDLKDRIECIFKLISDNAKRIEALNIKIEKHLSRGEGVLGNIQELKKLCDKLVAENDELKLIYAGIKIKDDTIKSLKKAFWIRLGVISTILTGVAGLAIFFK